MHDETSEAGAGVLLLLSGAALLVTGALYDARILGVLAEVAEEARAVLPRVRTALLLAGTCFFALGWLIHPRLALPRGVAGGAWRPAARRALGRPVVANALALLLPVVTILVLAEAWLRPFAHLEPKQTSIFVKDELMDWKLRPGATDMWGGVRVSISAKGTRSPAVPYPRGPKRRILYLGDSVLFGYGLEYADTVPARVEGALERDGAGELETVNLAVGGYETWQECVMLKTEGVKYSPDLVVLGFVLNDVTEGKDLVRFGGRSIGYQLSQSYYSLYDRLTHQSALLYSVERLRIRVLLGPDPKQEAIRVEGMSVKRLIDKPDDPAVRATWAEGLAELDKVYGFCRERELRLVVVIFPEAMQLLGWAANRNGPQETLLGHAEENGVECLDLLPALREARRSEGGVSPAEYFIDHNHLTAKGSRIAAEATARFLLERGLLPAKGHDDGTPR